MGRKTRYTEYAKGVQAIIDAQAEIANISAEKSVLARLKRLKNVQSKKNKKGRM